MITIENTEAIGWEAAIRGMRNPMNSWEKSDSFCSVNDKCHECPDNQKCDFYFSDRGTGAPYRNRFSGDFHYIGPNDYDLMTRLRNAGTDHRKFMRMITVYLDITAPLYWWKEFDTYKVGTVANSCSTMHKIADKEFTLEDFSHEHLTVESITFGLEPVIDILNKNRELYLQWENVGEEKKNLWWQMIQLLPSSYNQKRTVMLNYEVLANIYKSRNNHKLDEWCVHGTPEEHKFRNKDFASGMWGFCDWIESLPYSELITAKEVKSNDLG